MIRLATCLAVVLAATPDARAADIARLDGVSMALGTTHDIAYYTATPSGLALMATVGGEDGKAPVRFEVTLARGQSVTVSVPRDADEAALEIM